MAETPGQPEKMQTALMKWPPGLARLSLRDAVLHALGETERAELLSLVPEAYMIYELLSPGPKGMRYLELCGTGWTTLQQRLSEQKLVGTGCDPKDPFSPRRAIPSDRWKYAKINFEKWNARIGDIDVIEIEISSVGLRLLKSIRRIYWGGASLKLGTTLFPIFLSLVEEAKENRGVKIEHLMSKHSRDEPAIRLAIFRIKEGMQTAGFDKATCDQLIATEAGGYSLRVPAAEISIEE